MEHAPDVDKGSVVQRLVDDTVVFRLRLHLYDLY